MSDNTVPGICDPAESCGLCGRKLREVIKLLPTARMNLCTECVEICSEPVCAPDVDTAIEEGDVHFFAGRYKEAEPHYLLALVRLEQMYEKHDPRVLTCKEKLVDALIASDDLEFAAIACREVIAVRAVHNVESAASYLKLAKACEGLGNLEEAAENYKCGIQIAESQSDAPTLHELVTSCEALLIKLREQHE